MTKHDAEYFRRWRAAKQAEKRSLHTEKLGRPPLAGDHFPIEVLRRGQQLTAMMRTPIAMWPREFDDEI